MSPSTAKLDLFLFALQTYELDLKHFDTEQQERSKKDSSASLALEFLLRRVSMLKCSCYLDDIMLGQKTSRE